MRAHTHTHTFFQSQPGSKESIERVVASEDDSSESAPPPRSRAQTMGMPGPAMMMAGLGAAIAKKRQSSTTEVSDGAAAAAAAPKGGMMLPGLGVANVKLQPAGARGPTKPRTEGTSDEPTATAAAQFALRKRTATVASGDGAAKPEVKRVSGGQPMIPMVDAGEPAVPEKTYSQSELQDAANLPEGVTAANRDVCGYQQQQQPPPSTMRTINTG
jgi:hypothetical protein